MPRAKGDVGKAEAREIVQVEIDQPGIKERLWHSLRDDLARYVPATKSNKLLMCCACGRFLPQEMFTLEHIIPKQALSDDPPEVRAKVTANARSGNILLCNKPIIVKGEIVNKGGCNSWKGRFYDRPIKEVLNGTALSKRLSRGAGHHICASICLAFLALVERYGYQIALTPSGFLLRRQFFSPSSILRELPMKSQMLLSAAPFRYSEQHEHIWAEPFRFTMDFPFCLVSIKNIALYVPMSRDPNVPIAQHLLLKPQKYALRPNYETFFP